MNPTLITLSLGAALATPALAQRYAYSPAGAATTASYASITLPFMQSSGRPAYERYQQLHSDLRTTGPMIVKGIDLRPGGVGATQSARTVDLALIVAETDVSRANTAFDNNYVANKTTAIARKKISFPDLKTKGWTIPLTFDTLYVHPGNRDFLWEVDIHNISAPANASPSYYLDSYLHTPLAAVTNYGNTCTATGQSPPMNPQITLVTRANFQRLVYNFRVFYGAVSQPGGVALGFGRTNIPVPGWCTNVYTNPLVYLTGRTDTGGTFSTGVAEIPYTPALANVRFNAQFFCGDPKLGIALSQGLDAVTPTMPKGVAMRIWGDRSAPQGNTDTFGNSGLVVRIRP